MSDFLAELAGGVEIGNVSWAASRAISEGLSATAALRAFRDAGGAIRTQTWYRLYGEARAAMANREGLARLNYGSLPSDEHFTQWTRQGRPAYMYQVQVFTRDQATGDVMSFYHSTISDSVIAPDDAIGEAYGAYDSAAENYPELSGRVVLGAVLTGLYK